MTVILEDVAAEITEPGVYTMPAETYHADPVAVGSLSSSGAKLLLPPSTPAHFRWAADHPDTGRARHFDVGTAAHTLVLGNGAEIVRIEADSWRAKATNEKAAAARAEGKTPLLAAEHDTVLGMAGALRQNETAAALFQPGSGLPEQSLFWQDPETLIWRRARLDWLPSADGGLLIVGDYKSAKTASPTGASKAMADYSYHQQAAWYLDGVVTLGLAEHASFVFVFQEKTPPYLVSVIAPNEDAMRIARERNRKAIDVFRRCMEADHWPGYGDDVHLVGLPGWATYQHDRDAEAGAFDIEEIR